MVVLVVTFSTKSLKRGRMMMMCARGSRRGSMILYMGREKKMDKRSLKILMQNVKRRRIKIKHHRNLILSKNGKIIMRNIRSQTIKILKMTKTKILRLTRMPKYS